MRNIGLAARLGHKVTLYDENEELGGLVNVVSRTPKVYMAELRNITSWEAHELEKLPLEVKLGVKATPDMVRKAKPDVVILALGGQMRKLEAPGAEGENVIGLLDYLAGTAAVGERVAVLGGHEGAEAALHLREEFSTLGWIMEGLLERAGFRIEAQSNSSGFFAEYHCIRLADA